MAGTHARLTGVVIGLGVACVSPQVIAQEFGTCARPQVCLAQQLGPCTIRIGELEVPPGSTRIITASCLPDETMLSGGGTCDGIMSGSLPTSLSSWAIECRNFNRKFSTAQAYAICCESPTAPTSFGADDSLIPTAAYR